QYLKVVRTTLTLVIPAALALAVFARPIVKLLLGEDWLGLVAALRILALAGLARSIAGIAGWLCYAVGRPQLNFVIAVVRAGVVVALLYPFMRSWGLEGAAAAVLVSNLATLPLLPALHRRAADIGTGEYCRAVALPALTGSAFMGAAALGAMVWGNLLSTGFVASLLILSAAYLLLWFRTDGRPILAAVRGIHG
ncbi:MAG: polysaccharide biosynthesis C-terminal domain-containing protein, partial [Actinomycetota bacterium]